MGSEHTTPSSPLCSRAATMREILSGSDGIRLLRSGSSLGDSERLRSDSAAVGDAEATDQQDSPEVLPVEGQSAWMDRWEHQPVHVEVVHQQQPASDEGERERPRGDATK